MRPLLSIQSGLPSHQFLAMAHSKIWLRPPLPKPSTGSAPSNTSLFVALYSVARPKLVPAGLAGRGSVSMRMPRPQLPGIRSITAAVIAVMPVLMVGSGTGGGPKWRMQRRKRPSGAFGVLEGFGIDTADVEHTNGYPGFNAAKFRKIFPAHRRFFLNDIRFAKPGFKHLDQPPVQHRFFGHP